MAHNLYEELGRTRKVYALVKTLESVSRDVVDMCGYDALVSWAKTLTDEQWTKVAVCAGIHPPSEKTRAAVIEAIEARAEKLKLARADYISDSRAR